MEHLHRDDRPNNGHGTACDLERDESHSGAALASPPKAKVALIACIPARQTQPSQSRPRPRQTWNLPAHARCAHWNLKSPRGSVHMSHRKLRTHRHGQHQEAFKHDANHATANPPSAGAGISTAAPVLRCFCSSPSPCSNLFSLGLQGGIGNHVPLFLTRSQHVV